MTLHERLEAALAGLPDTAEGIAALLLAEGVKGEQSCLTRCPLAVWLSFLVGAQCSVGSDQAWLVGDQAWLVGDHEYVDLPEAALWFVSRFDGDHSDEPRTCDWPELAS